MTSSSDWLEELARRADQGEAVDWDAEISRAGTPADRSKIQNLRRLAEFAQSSPNRPSASESEHDATVGVPRYSPSDDGFPDNWAHLELVERLDAGASGTVFRARDTRLDIDVALKLVADPDEVYTFEEAQRLARVRHPNVLTVHGVERHDGWLGMWTELVDGSTLDSFLSTTGSMSAPEASSIGRTLARAVSAVHGAGLVHGDIKCANAMRERGGRIVLMDFGLASETRDASFPAPIRGTPLYMAPELLDGSPRSVATDIYALGVVLFRLVTQRHPVPATTVEEVLEFHRSKRDITSLWDLRPDLPEAFLQVVAKCLEREPSRRFGSAGTVAQALAPLSGSAGDGDGDAPVGTEEDMEGSVAGEDGVAASLSDERSLADAASEGPTGGGSESETLGGRTSSAHPNGRLVWIFGLIALVAVSAWFIPNLRNRSSDPAGVDSAATTGSAFDSSRRVVVLNFENLADPKDESRMGEIIPSLLITDLSQSEYTQVVSTQRIYDILKQMGREGQRTVDPTIAVDVAKRAQASRMVTGSIVQTDPATVVTSQLIDVASGDIIGSERLEGEPGESVFHLVDRLSKLCRTSLELPAEAAFESDPELSETMTNSPEAYRHFLRGIDHIQKFDREAAAVEFRHAVEADSGFAQAWAELANAERGTAKRRELATKAVEASETRGTWQSRLLIRSLWADLHGRNEEALDLAKQVLEREPDNIDALFYAAFVADELDRRPLAISYWERVAELDPTDKVAWNNLAYLHARDGRFEVAFQALGEYERIAPDEPNPHDSRGEFLTWMGKPEEALAAFEKALEIRPGWWAPMRNSASVLVMLGRDEEAAARFGEMARSESQMERSIGRNGLAFIPANRGRYKESIERLEDAVRASRFEAPRGGWLNLIVQSQLYFATGDTANALECAREAASFEVGIPAEWGTETLIQQLARTGQLDEAKEVFQGFVESFGEADVELDGNYWSAQSAMAEVSGDLERAIYLMERAKNSWPDVWVATELGRLYLENDRIEEAVTTLEEASRYLNWDRITCVSVTLFIPYHLGRAYEASGWYKKSREQYTRFLTQLKDADFEFPEVKDAERRLARLPS